MTVCTTIGGMVMTVRWNGDDCVYNHRWNGDDCVHNPRWNGDDCEGGFTVLCVQPWVEW